eukprot:TRINITY_DN7627_c0_g3_i1.p1 TRINITY_DN7627_c0_g3~~TRINITY_DN7627_c0_g3_i1.p1  ORF type:complete len:140 (+),score=21.27 TRINITY_DN7627_c0_g3_i1:433-852(+)
MAFTFHGWIGSRVNCLAARVIGWLAFTLHGSGVKLPTAVPTTLPELRSAFKYMRRNQEVESVSEVLLNLYANTPGSLSRQHVDWILVSGRCLVQMVFVAEVRDQAFSSDHFPVLAVLQVRTQAADLGLVRPEVQSSTPK